ncbi:winged helix DNA-binding domain-containing protein [Kibdelosporangium philippinense]|uniref:Winged helix DNA-binding domain-containing protein n=1 Tax=Kibdelosporangium philippinense TaxID=211113 RepID=A0ABS8Z7X5_9PSEU|nr:winged helix DNA-binding domain-containing protein [Kibdelosporangium philippinense]MCE7003983.1 winged helix DNA-binding domain-containing protein [Kibdelosporangium philippinense]
MGISQRRARLGRRHLLAATGATAVDVAEAMVALHATDPATVYLSIVARQRVADGLGIERALYEDRTVVRMLGMRRTVFVVPADLVAVVQEACSRDVAARLRRGLVQHIAEVDKTGEWLSEVEDAVAAALRARGSATAAQLAEDEPRLRTPLVYAPDKAYGTTAFITTRVLGLLAADGRIVRGRPRGSWLSGQYMWAMLDDWLPNQASWSPEAARACLARRWLATFGPAPISDLRWWTGWTVGQTKKALAELGPVEVDMDGVPGIALADDLEPVPDPPPWVALLPGLDSTPMGWQSRDWFLGGHGPALFDRSGNVGPTVWSDGRIVGGWAQRRSGEIAVELLEDVGAEVMTAIEAEATRLQEWLGDARVTPRFRTPLERKLSE